MPGGVDDIDFIIVILERGVLCRNGNSALFFKIHGIHQTFSDLFIGTESSCLFNQVIHESCLPVIDVRNNRNISNFLRILNHLTSAFRITRVHPSKNRLEKCLLDVNYLLLQNNLNLPLKLPVKSFSGRCFYETAPLPDSPLQTKPQIF